MKKKVGIICNLDGYANSNMPNAIRKKLESLGADVTMINVFKPDKAFPSLYTYLDKSIAILHTMQNTFLPFLKPLTNYAILTIWQQIRSFWLFRVLKKKQFDLIIGETQLDAAVFLKPLKTKTYYDNPTPWADELFFGGEITESQYKKMLDGEKKVYSKVDYLSFHWDVYTDYVKKYIYDGPNHIRLNSGCTIKKEQATYQNPPKIVYLGFLGGYWINLELLSHLSSLYPIDVYGSPAPDKKYQLNYKGYAKPEILSHYQLGLITLSKDRLRSEGFSAKHVEYLSYGLPVLMPEWRTSVQDMKGTMFYNEHNFLEIVKDYSTQTRWQKAHEEALSEAQNYSWDTVLKPIEKIYQSL